jgi:hypothetical protein
MADLASDFDFLVATVERCISQLRARVEPASKDGRGTELREHMEEALSAIEDRVTTSQGRFGAAVKDVERESVIDSMRLLSRTTVSMHEAADWLNAARDSDVHIGVHYFVDEAAAAIVGIDTDVILVGDAAYQYATVSWPFALILARLKRTSEVAARPIVLFFPPQEMQTALLHSLLAHELAHAAVDQHRLVEGVLKNHRDTAAFRKDFKEVAQWLADSYSITLPEARFRLNGHLDSWTTERLCDAIAIEYLGPTYVLAFAAVVLATSWSEPSQTHPPTTLRIAAMLEQLRLRGWDQLLQTAIPRTFSWLEGVGSAPMPRPPQHERFLIDWTHKFAADIDAAAVSRLGSSAYSPREFDAVSPEISELLELEILPSQLLDREAIDRRAILLAGWLQVFELHGDSPSSIAKGNLNDKFQDFLGTAMEMSVILETWKQV